jgi:hypothetical protein
MTRNDESNDASRRCRGIATDGSVVGRTTANKLYPREIRRRWTGVEK